MIHMQKRDSTDCPTVYCEGCKEAIRKAGRGLYVWDILNPGEIEAIHRGARPRLTPVGYAMQKVRPHAKP